MHSHTHASELSFVCVCVFEFAANSLFAFVLLIKRGRTAYLPRPRTVAVEILLRQVLRKKGKFQGATGTANELESF